MRTCDSHRVKGWWFLPDAPNVRVPGILVWTPNSGAELELIGGLSGNHAGSIESDRQADADLSAASSGTIYGETDAGKAITLWDAQLHSYNGIFGGSMIEEIWHSSWVCVGHYVASADERSLSYFRVAFDDLYFLTDDGRFCAPYLTEIEGVDHPGEQQSNGTLVVPFVIPVVGGVKADIATGSTSSANYNVYTNATRPPWLGKASETLSSLTLEAMTTRTRSGLSIAVEVNAWVRIDPVMSPASARDVLDEINPMLALISLATFSSGGVESISSVTVDDIDVSILCHLNHPGHPDAITKAHTVFNLSDVSLESFMHTWDRLGTDPQGAYARNMTIAQIGHYPIMVEEQISQALASAEGFHRWCLKGGDKTLKVRLIDLHDRLPSTIRARLKLNGQLAKWADWAVWARNNVDHGGATKHRHVGDFTHLKILADSVRLITYLVALQEFGVPSEKIMAAISSHSGLNVLAQRCEEVAKLPEA